MKTLSHWASRHTPLAILLIIICEITNGFNGLTLGAAWFDALPIAGLHAGIAVLLSLAVGIRLMARLGTGHFGLGRWCLFDAFLSNFLLFGLLGGLMAPRIHAQNASTAAWGSRRVEVRTDTLTRPDALRPVQSATAVSDEARSNNQGGKRAGYVLLFVLGLFLTYFTTALACSIACSGYGFLAVVVLLVGFGFAAVGIYFLGRALDKQLKNRSEMSPAERRRTGRRFWISWVFFIGLAAVSLLLSAIF